MRFVSAFSFSAPHYRFQNAGKRVPCQGIRGTELPLSIGLLHNPNSDATKCQSNLKSGMDFSMLVISRAYNRCVKTPTQVHRWYKKPARKKMFQCTHELLLRWTSLDFDILFQLRYLFGADILVVRDWHVYSSHAPRLHSFSYPQTASHANDPSLKPPVRSSALFLSMSSSRVLCSTRDGQLFSAQYDTSHPPHKSVSASQVHMQCRPTIEPLEFKNINRKVSLRSHNSSALPLNNRSLFRCHGISNATLVCTQS